MKRFCIYALLLAGCSEEPIKVELVAGSEEECLSYMPAIEGASDIWSDFGLPLEPVGCAVRNYERSAKLENTQKASWGEFPDISSSYKTSNSSIRFYVVDAACDDRSCNGGMAARVYCDNVIFITNPGDLLAAHEISHIFSLGHSNAASITNSRAPEVDIAEFELELALDVYDSLKEVCEY